MEEIFNSLTIISFSVISLFIMAVSVWAYKKTTKK